MLADPPSPSSLRTRFTHKLTILLLAIASTVAATVLGSASAANALAGNALAGNTASAAGTTTRVGAWTASLAGGGNGITNQTVRMVVHTTVAGSSVRVRLSNLYGSNPLPIGAVDVAVQASGGSPIPGTHHTATFAGPATTTLPAGTEIASDPLDMSVTAEENLLVSVYFPGNAGASSWHWQAMDTTYYSAPGNFTGDDTTANYPASDASWYYLEGLDVESSTAQGTLVAFGDSITDGALSTTSANNRWPNILARRLQNQPGGPAFGVVDAGIGGNRLLTDTGNQFGTSALHRFAHDALGQPSVKAVILLEGINDIGVNTGPNGALTAQDLINAYQTLITQAHAAGVKIYGGTILPYQGAGTYTSGGEAIREAANQWIRTSGAFDGVEDFDAAMGAPGNPLQLNPAYDSGDHLHPNDAGYTAMGNAVNLTTLTGGTGTGGDTTAPSAPTGLAASGTSSSSTTLSWNASTDNVGVTGYDVYRNGVQVGTATGTSYTDSALSAPTSYTYTVKAFDAAGNVSAASNTTTVTTSSSVGGGTGGAVNPSAWYTVANTNSGKCVDATGGGASNGTAVQQWACGGVNTNQQWQFQPTDSGYYKVVSHNATTEAWDVSGGAGSTGDGAQIQLWSYGGGTNQQWKPTQNANGGYTFTARNSGTECLDVTGLSTSDGTRLQQWTCNGDAAQSFTLTPQ